MAYTNINFRTKKALKDAVKNGEKVHLSAWPPFSKFGKNNDMVCVEGPHYPKPHSWYATVTLDADGAIVKVK